MSNAFKYTLYQNGKELGLVFSDDEADILEIWSDLKSVSDGKESPVWYLKEKGYHAGINSWWENKYANK